MKLTNKGFEFQKIENVFRKKDILIYGAGFVGERLYNSISYLHDNVHGWIDREEKCLYDLPTYSFVNLTQKLLEENIIIIAVDEPLASLFSRQLISLGLVENKDFYRYWMWQERYKYIYNLYRNGKVTASFCGLQISNVCNLNCKGCLSFTHFINTPHFYGFDYVKNNAQSLFKHVDYIDTRELCGGEPFLIPNVEEIYTYVHGNYKDRVGLISTVTNATVVPTDELCEVFRRNNIKVFVDDYRENVDHSRLHFDEVIDKMKLHDVCYEIRKVENWIDLGLHTTEENNELYGIMKHSECNNNRLSVINEKLFFCDYECYADMAGVYVADRDDYIDLKNCSMTKSEIEEFILGYSNKGYCSMCARCYGDGKVNQHFIPVAEQYK